MRIIVLCDKYRDNKGVFSRERIVVGHEACSLFGEALEFDVQVRVANSLLTL